MSYESPVIMSDIVKTNHDYSLPLFLKMMSSCEKMLTVLMEEIEQSEEGVGATGKLIYSGDTTDSAYVRLAKYCAAFHSEINLERSKYRDPDIRQELFSKRVSAFSKFRQLIKEDVDKATLDYFPSQKKAKKTKNGKVRPPILKKKPESFMSRLRYFFGIGDYVKKSASDESKRILINKRLVLSALGELDVVLSLSSRDKMALLNASRVLIDVIERCNIITASNHPVGDASTAHKMNEFTLQSRHHYSLFKLYSSIYGFLLFTKETLVILNDDMSEYVFESNVGLARRWFNVVPDYSKARFELLLGSLKKVMGKKYKKRIRYRKDDCDDFMREYDYGGWEAYQNISVFSGSFIACSLMDLLDIDEFDEDTSTETLFNLNLIDEIVSKDEFGYQNS